MYINKYLSKTCVTYMFTLSPKWDMHWLRAKEIKDSSNSQAVPKIPVHKKWHCLVPHRLRFLLFSNTHDTCMTSFAELALSNALIFPNIQDQRKAKTAWLYMYKHSLIPWNLIPWFMSVLKFIQVRFVQAPLHFIKHL